MKALLYTLFKSKSVMLLTIFTIYLIQAPAKAQCEIDVEAILSDNTECGADNCNLLCFESSDGNDDVSAQMEVTTNQNGEEITIRTTYAKSFCDNTYGENTIGWPGDNHTFNHLKGSDKLELELYNADGELALKFKLDYIHDNDLGPSGYATGGVSDPDGDGKMLYGDEDHVLNVRTSLSENFNTFGYELTSNSPATDENYTPNSDYPNWIYEVWYEVTVSADAFGESGYGHPEISDFHASPSKTGNNSEPIEFVGCCGDDCDGSIDITVNDENSPYTFNWSNGESTEDIFGLCAGDYTLEVTDINGCESTFTYTINDPIPIIEVEGLVIDNSDCEVDTICEVLCFESTNGNEDVSAQMAIDIDQDGEQITLRTTYAKTFCDNTYGDNTIGWPGNNHSFNHLRGSDKLELELYDANGDLQLKFKLDYIHDNDLGPSGYATGGVSDPDGDGKMILGDEDHILNVKTSLSENFNTFGYELTEDSPETDENYTPNPDYPNWIFDVWYEVTVSTEAFGDVGFGHPEISDFHSSPSKTGNDSEPIEFVGCCDSNCDGAIDLTVTEGEGPFSFLWSNGETTEDIDGLCPGFYSVLVFDINSCSKEFEFEVGYANECEMICPEDITLSCGSSVDPEDTGMPSVSENCVDMIVNYSDSVVTSCGANQEIFRTWFIEGPCFTNTSCIQLISLIDTIPPILFNLPSDLELECGEEIPEPADVYAEDNCDEDVIIVFEEVDNAIENSQCSLETPFGLAGNWAMWLPDFGTSEGLSDLWVLDAEGGVFIENEDGSATITGHLINENNPDYGFDLDLLLEDKKNWEDWHDAGGNYKDEFGFGADHYEDWSYYILSSTSTLTGTGDNEGAILNLSHAPANQTYAFQVGIGANVNNENYGCGGWFDYTGSYNGEEVSGVGDVGFDISCIHCDYSIIRVWIAIDNCGNYSSFTQIITIGSAPIPSLDEIWVPEAEEQELAVLSSYPNPFSSKSFVRLQLDEKSQVSLQLINTNGKIIEEIYRGPVNADQAYLFEYDAKELPAGVYLYKLITSKDSFVERVILTR